MQTQRTISLIAMNGLKPFEEWTQLSKADLVRYLALLDAVQLRGQASVCAAGLRVSVDYVLGGWIARGLISHDRAVQAMIEVRRAGD